MKFSQVCARTTPQIHSDPEDQALLAIMDGIQDLGEAAVTELLVDWLDAFITETECEGIVAWDLGVSL